MKLKNITIFLLVSTLSACSNDKSEEIKSGQEIPEAIQPTIYTTFTDEGEYAVPGSNPAIFSARALRIKGDTLFVANNHQNDRAIYIAMLSTGQTIGKISQWMRGDVSETFNAEIGDIAITEQYIYVGMYNSRINVFDRKTLKFINVIGRTDGKWGDDMYSMTHCYGLHESGSRLMVRDKNTIRGYWMYETVTEPATRVPWIGKVLVNVGYDYEPRTHSMAEYQGRMYLTDWYGKSLQVFTPSKMEIVFGEATHIQADTILKLDIQPLGLLAYGEKLLVSSQKSDKILRYYPGNGQLIDTLAAFKGRELGRMEMGNDYLYYIDLKTNKLMKARGENPETAGQK